MRRVDKRWPPSSIVARPHQTLSEAEADFLTALLSESNPGEYARGRFDELDKKGLRQEFYQEQHGLCIYCEATLSSDLCCQELKEKPSLPIEHWQPLSLVPEKAFHWKNLYLSCCTPDTCDGSKADIPLNFTETTPLPWPCTFEYQTVLAYDREGRIYVKATSSLSLEEREHLEKAIGAWVDPVTSKPPKPGSPGNVLNLNHPELCRARRKALDQLRVLMERRFPNHHASLAQRKALAQELLQQFPLLSFISVRVAWLENELGKGKPPYKATS
jgi:uncharacterized protein (TIGR02646 family)